MATQQIVLKEEVLREMVYNTIMETLEENPELMEGFFGDMWAGVKGAGQAAGQAIAQHGNSLKANYYAGAANNKKQEISNEIKKCQQTIRQMNAKIQQLRTQLNGYQDKSRAATAKANQMAADRGVSTQYSDRVGGNVRTDTNRFSSK